MNKGTSDTKTVTFNVGGATYQVSKSLLSMYPDSLLSKKAAEANGDKESGAEIFLDRDSDRFRYVLDWMRNNGKVFLPVTVSKNALVQDLKYYAFDNVNESLIDDSVCLSLFVPKVNALLAKTHEAKRSIDQMGREQRMQELSLLCLGWRIGHNQTTRCIRKNDDHFKLVKSLMPVDQNALIRHLWKLGMRASVQECTERHSGDPYFSIRFG